MAKQHMLRFLFAADGASDWGDVAPVLSAQPSLLGQSNNIVGQPEGVTYVAVKAQMHSEEVAAMLLHLVGIP
jgi:hypothetical protein